MVDNVTSCSLVFSWCKPDGVLYDNISAVIEPPIEFVVVDDEEGMCDRQVLSLVGLEPETMYNLTLVVMSGERESDPVVIQATTGMYMTPIY